MIKGYKIPFAIFVVVTIMSCQTIQDPQKADITEEKLDKYIKKLPTDLQYFPRKPIPEKDNAYVIMKELYDSYEFPNDKMYDKMQSIIEPYGVFPSQNNNELLEFIEKNKKNFVLVDEITKCTNCRYPEIYGPDTPLGYLKSLRHLIKLRIVYIKYLCTQKQYNKATEELLKVIELSNFMVKQNSSLIHHMVSWSILSYATKTANYFSYQKDFPRKCLKEILDKMPIPTKSTPNLSNTLNVEFCRSALWRYCNLLEGKGDEKLYYLLDRFQTKPSDEIKEILLAHPNLLEYDHFIDDMILIFRESKENINKTQSEFILTEYNKTRVIQESYPALLKYLNNPKFDKEKIFNSEGKVRKDVIDEFYTYKNPIGKYYISEDGEYLNHYAPFVLRFKTRVEMSRLNLALQIYFKKNKAYPDTLEDLAKSKILKSMPVDFYCDMEPFDYSKDKHIFWSYGKNYVDDDAKGNVAVPHNGDDWIFDFTPFESATYLSMAIYNNDEFAVKELLKAYDIKKDSLDFSGCSPVHAAIFQQNIDFLNLLAGKHFNLNVRSTTGNAPIHLCLKKGKENLLKSLLKKGADPNLTFKTPSFEMPSLSIAAYHKDNCEIMELLLSNGARLNEIDYLGTNALGVAAATGNKKNSDFLLEKGINLNGKELIVPPLLNACSLKGNIDIVKKLVKAGADINTVALQKNTPLMEAIIKGDIEIVKFLLESNADVNKTNPQGKTALHVASILPDKQEYIMLLLEKGADPNAYMQFKKIKKATPLMFAVKNYDRKVIKEMIAKGADINHNENGLSALINAMGINKFDNARFLLEQGADPDVEAFDGSTPLILAIKNNKLDIVKDIHKTGVPLTKPNKKGVMPFLLASALGHKDIVKYMIGEGVDMNTRNNKDVNALIGAVARKNTDMVKYLVDLGCVINHRVNKKTPFYNHSALSLAKQGGTTEIVDILKAKKATEDIKYKDIITSTVKARVEDKGDLIIIENPVTGYILNKNGMEQHVINWNFFLTPDDLEDMEIGTLLEELFGKSSLKISDDIKEISKTKTIINGHSGNATILSVDSGKMLFYVCDWYCPESRRFFVSMSSYVNEKRLPEFKKLLKHVNCHFKDFDYTKFIVNPVPQKDEGWSSEVDDESQVFAHDKDDLEVVLFRGFSLPAITNLEKQMDIASKMFLEILKHYNLMNITKNDDPEIITLMNQKAVKISCKGKIEEVFNFIRDCDIVIWKNNENDLYYFALIIADNDELKQKAYPLLNSIKYEIPEEADDSDSKRKKIKQKQKDDMGKIFEKEKPKELLTKIDNEGKANVKFNLARELKSGYLSIPESIETIVEIYSDEYDPNFLKPIVTQFSHEIVSGLIKEAATWPDTTDCDRLDKAFAELETKGIIARQDFSCCGSCGSGEIREEMEKVEKSGKKVRGYVFFHQQDTDSAVEGAGLFLCYGSSQKGKKSALNIANEIVKTIKKHGLKIDWNGTWDKRIGVEVDWKKRTPWMKKKNKKKPLLNRL